MNRNEQEWLSEFIAFQEDTVLYCWVCEAPLCQRWEGPNGEVELEEIAKKFVVYACPQTREPSLWLCRDDATVYEDGQDKGRN